MTNKSLFSSYVDYCLKVFINTSAVLGIYVLWDNFNTTAYETVLSLAAAAFTWPSDKKEEEEEKEE